MQLLATRRIRNRRAAEIVRQLACDDVPCVHLDKEMYHWCLLCGVHLPVGASDHRADCTWRLASEWVDEHGVGPE